jgi:hypothetical protein
MRSIVWKSAASSASSLSASRPNGREQRLTMNPGESRRVGRRRRDRRDRDRRRVRREDRLGRDLRQPAEQLALDLERLGRRLDDELALREVRQLARRLEALSRPRGVLRAPAPALRSALELLRDPLERALECGGVRVVHERTRAGERAELRNAGAHRPGPDDADDPRCCAHAPER